MAPSDNSVQKRRVASPPPTDPQTRAEALSVAARALRSAEHVCVLTGAGVSAESGIPTFREAQTGTWAQFSPQELATPEAFANHPKRVWQWYAARRAMVRAAQPNPAHTALVTLASRVAHCTLVTQNVDDLHERAGSRDVVRLHGSLMHVRCGAGCPGSVPAADEPGAEVPACPTCGALMRPDVVWFGEQLPMPPLRGGSQCGRRLRCVPLRGHVKRRRACGLAAVDFGHPWCHGDRGQSHHGRTAQGAEYPAHRRARRRDAPAVDRRSVRRAAAQTAKRQQLIRC